MTLAAIPILDVWYALGGGTLRGRRGRSFWRAGDGYSVALDQAKGTWFDHRAAHGGGTLSLVETVLGCSRVDALRWLEQNCGLDSRHSLSPEERTQYAQRITERTDAQT